MKQQRNERYMDFRVNLLAASVALAFASNMALATDLADLPLANSTTLAVPPNIALMVDDSGSMHSDYMPDGISDDKNKYCYKWYQYNTLAYNPAILYKAPPKADGNRFSDALFNQALSDGYFAEGAREYDGSTTNTADDLNLLTSVSSLSVFPDFGSSKHQAISVLVTKPDNSTVDLLATSPVPSSSTSNEDTVGRAVRDGINAGGICSASYQNSGNKLTITCPSSLVKSGSSPNVVLQNTTGVLEDVTENAFDSPSGLFYATHKTNPNSTTTCDSDGNFNIVSSKTDIAAPGTSNGSPAALTNYANWYSYYRKRNMLMKAGVGEAFAKLDQDKFRIGYFTISSKNSEVTDASSMPNTDLAIADFKGTSAASHRSLWFDKLYGTKEAGYTPLRGALSRMGRMYSGKISGFDPIQYSCQRNYTILTSDGYWNTNWENSSYGPKRENNTTNVGDQDGPASVLRPERDNLKIANTLADIAYYYYHNDLRTPDKNNCGGAPRADSSTGDVCNNDVPGVDTDDGESDFSKEQHMTTFTLGLGVTGSLTFDPNYKTAASGDYVSVKSGTLSWPDPINSSTARIDDLWHAAVNGRGLYLSAKNPVDLAMGLSKVLNSMDAVSGAGAGAAAANLAPVSGGTKMYIALYKTDEWYGDVAAFEVNAAARTVAGSPDWKVSTWLDGHVSTSSDSRTIYANVGGIRKAFLWSDLSAEQRAYFDNTKLSQYAEWTSTQKSSITGEALVNYLRGQTGNEIQTGNTDTLYRDRSHVLGDIVHSAPMYVKESHNSFVDDPTYGHRNGMLYVAANDGMLHAFCTEAGGSCTTEGQELWAYVIPHAMQNMWYIADNLQRGLHHFIADGPLSVADIQISGEWRTVLLGGLGKGGRSFYAIDITEPVNPTLLWSYSAEGVDELVNTDDDQDSLGYSYGLPLTAKVENKDWRVLFTSGYNNVKDTPNTGDFPDADGKGHVFMIDPDTGTESKDILAGSDELAQINTHTPNFSSGNAATKAYGGDLGGNMWQFDLVAGSAATKVIGTGKPIMTGTAISSIDGHAVLLFGTGRYLGQTDITNTTQNYLVGVRADKSGLSLSDLINRTAQDDTTVNWSTDNGWYIALSAGEQVHIDPVVYGGVLVVATIVPEGSECTPGGYSYFHMIDINTGKMETIPLLDDAVVGFSIFDLGISDPDNPTSVGYTTAKGEIKFLPKPLPKPAGGSGLPKGTRIMWRELIDNP